MRTNRKSLECAFVVQVFVLFIIVFKNDKIKYTLGQTYVLLENHENNSDLFYL